MKKNLGKTDKTLRILTAVVFIMLVTAGITGNVASVILIALSATLIFTSSVSFCPLYIPFKFNTKKEKK